MGDVNFKIVPEASVFRGDADFDGPGAQKYHFWIKRPFWKIFFENMFSKHIFRDIFFKKTCQKNFFRKMGLGATLVLGVGPGKLLPWLTPWFLKTFLVTKRVAVGAIEAPPVRKIARLLQRSKISGQIGHGYLLLQCFLEKSGWGQLWLKNYGDP